MSTFEEFLVYYTPKIKNEIQRQGIREEDGEDIFQEISLTLLLLWRKYQESKITFLTTSYIQTTIWHTLRNVLTKNSLMIDQSRNPFRTFIVQSFEDFLMVLSHQQITNPLKFLEIERKVLLHLDDFEQDFYFRLKEGYTQNEIFRILGFRSGKKYGETREKIKELFKKYL